MSWMKRAGGAPPPAEQPRYAPGQSPQPPRAQAFGNQQSMYPNYSSSNTPQQQYWQTPPQQQAQYNQQYGQTYQQPSDYAMNANQFYQQQPPPQYSQNYSGQSFGTSNQQGYQQGYYPNQNQGIQQQSYPQNNHGADGWDDNWDWGWEDSSKAQKGVIQNTTQMTAQPPPQQQTQQVYNNANVIEESFATTDGWNWAMEDKKEAVEPPVPPTQQNNPATLPVDNPPFENNSVTQANAQNVSAHSTEEVKTLNDKEIVKECLPNLALGKRFHLDNLTPQWSIESQMSQESSDGPHTHSEGTYRSENQSRNSNKSSPGLNTDNSNFNYSQPSLDDSYPQNQDWSKNSVEEPTLVDNVLSDSRQESNDDLSASLQEMSITNSENPAPNSLTGTELNVDNKPENTLQPPPAVSPTNLLHSAAVKQPSPVPRPPSATSSNVPPVPPTSMSLPPPPSASASMPPTNFPPAVTSQNPFKSAGPISHKNISKASPGNLAAGQSFSAPISSASLTSPAVVNKVSQHSRVPVGFSANLETTPDNSERPDQPQVLPFRPMPIAQQVPENLEVAPKNDRNEYLQTAHLSSGDYGENTDFSRTMPPPGLQRMVLGQQESEYNQNINISTDGPPPGFTRMVPGQQTEVENVYNQPNDNYLDRHIDGQPTDGNGRPYRQADGQQTSDNYSQPPPSRGNERRPIGLDRMVPGESSNIEYSQYPSSNYAGTNEPRVVTGVDHDYSISTDAGPSDIREQNVDGSDYTDQSLRNAPRNIIGVRDTDISADFNAAPEEQQREVVMEGENLQDLSAISSTDLTFSREQTLDGADENITDTGIDRKTDASDSIENPASSSRRQSLNHVNTSGDDSERDRLFKSSPRRDRHKLSRDRDRERDKEGRYSRGDRKYDRDPDRRSARDDRWSEKDMRERDKQRDKRERDESPDSRRHRRSARSHRYETEDTDYYSDREKERRRYREGSYTSSKPPRPDDKERRYEDRDRGRRYHTIERDRRYDDDHDGTSRRRDRDRDRPRDRDRDRDRDRYGERRYRDIDPSRKYGNLKRDRDEEERRRGEYESPSRAESREPRGDDRERRHRRPRHSRAYYDGYGSGVYDDPYAVQRQQYQYYEHLRLTNPAAYMQVYKQLMAGQQPPPPPPDFLAKGLMSLRDYQAEERGSVHSGRSSANDLKTDTELNTDASLNLQLEESTVRSERMTPFKFSTAHIKGNIGTRDVVVVRPSYPVDGLPATVQVLSLAAAVSSAASSDAAELAAFPGPLVKGITHKKSVMEYCLSRVSWARRAAPHDALGYVLLWELLALLLRQNGVVVGTDIAELLMKNKREYEYKTTFTKPTHDGSRRESSLSGSARDDERDGERTDRTDRTEPDDNSSYSDNTPQESAPQISEEAALDRLRELLIYGNRQEALEFAMSNALWGHALQLAAHCERRTRAAVSARFVAALPRSDPLHTLYAALAARLPPAATCVSDERWGDWRPHAAIVLANGSAKPDQDRRTLVQLGDSLAARGLLYSAQFCYMAGGLEPQRHPLAPLAAGDPPAAPPRLSLLLADPRAPTLPLFATNQAIFATEIYEYAMSLNRDYVIEELQVYKLVAASRLADAGAYERALAYTEQAARALARAPRRPSPRLARALAHLADRLKYHDPALQDDAAEEDEAGAARGDDSGEPSPRHQQWLHDIQQLAADARPPPPPSAEEVSLQTTPVHQHQQQVEYYAQYGGWPAADQVTQPQYQQQAQPYQEATEQVDYSQYYQQPAPESQPQLQLQPEPEQAPAPYGDEWAARPADDAQQYDNGYWQGDSHYGYGERAPSLRRRLRAGPPPPPPAPPLSPPPPPPPPAPAAVGRPRAPLSDLDIQVAHGARPASRSPSPAGAAAVAAAAGGDVIRRTVECWCGARAGGAVGGATRRPLVFGGTFPIEVPVGGGELARRVRRSVRAFDQLRARRAACSFPVDAPAAAPRL